MSRHLVVLFVVVQSLDLLTYLQAPHLEANPAMAALPPMGVAIAKLAGVCLALVVISRIRTASLQSLALAIGIAIGAFGLGANVASLSIVAAAEAPRSAPEPAPTPRGAGFEKGVVPSPVAPGRTAAPSTSAAPGPSPLPVVAIDTRVVPRRVVPDRRPLRDISTPKPVVPRGTGLRGVATWFAAPSGTAAAGPALRAVLGPGWRGQRVSVCAGERCVTVRLADWCACGPRHGAPTLLDLSDDAFAQLAPLSRGIVRIRIVP